MPDVRDMKAVWTGYGETQLPLKRCPNCGAEARTQLARCPECNRRYDRLLPWLTDPMRWALGVLALIAFGVGCWMILPGVFEERDAGNARRAAQQRALEEATRQRLVREQRPIRGEGAPEPSRASDAVRRGARVALVGVVEATILEDARRRTGTGELEGDVQRVECGPLIRTPGRPPDDQRLESDIGRYDCIAVEADVLNPGRKKVATFGHPYVAALDFSDGTFVFCKDNKAPGERGKALAHVPLDPSCLGLPPDAKRLGNGYVIPED